MARAGSDLGSVSESRVDWTREGSSTIRGTGNGYALSVLVGFSVLLVSLLAAMVLRSAEQRALDSAVDQALETITTEVEQGVDRQLYDVIIHAWRWEWNGGEAREGWIAGARSLIDRFPLLHGIVWLDQDYKVLVREPEGDAGLRISGLVERAEIRASLNRARDERRVVGLTTQGADGDRIFMVHVALDHQNKHRGFTIGAYELQSLLSNIFVSEPSGFRVEISDAAGPIWTSVEEVSSGAPIRHGLSSTLTMNWKISVSPGATVMKTYLTWLPSAIGFGGAFVGLLVGLALFMNVDSRYKAQRLSEGNARLLEEMALRGRAEKGEREVEDELTETLNTLPVHVWSARVAEDGELIPRRMSTVLARISGRSPEYFDGQPGTWLSVIHPDDRTRLAKLVKDMIEGRLDVVDFDYRLVREDGTIRYMSDSVRSTKLKSGRRLDGLSRDVTDGVEAEAERLRLEARFQQAQKFESLGVLAGGVAHDFNNLLVAMLGHARLAEEDLPDNSPIQQNLASVIKAARQAGELCGQMLAYAGEVPIVTEAIALDEIVEEMGDLLRASIPSSTFIRFGFDKELPCIQGDASQVRQVALNLITNASEAIGEGGGEISLSVRTADCTQRDLSEMEYSEDLEPGCYVALTVTDTGIGMEDETRKKIFEPFYSTKFAGRGLGLAAVVGIVRAHGGALRIESEANAGSSFSVFFPAAESRATHEVDASPREAASWNGRGKLLLVEDEDSARDLARTVLERHGIEVVEAVDGMEAVAIFQADPEAFGGVLLDLTMPNMDGVETYARMRSIRADIRVVLCSGYPERAAVARFADLGLAGFLKKPYEPDELLDSVTRMGGAAEILST